MAGNIWWAAHLHISSWGPPDAKNPPDENQNACDPQIDGLKNIFFYAWQDVFEDIFMLITATCCAFGLNCRIFLRFRCQLCWIARCEVVSTANGLLPSLRTWIVGERPKNPTLAELWTLKDGSLLVPWFFSYGRNIYIYINVYIYIYMFFLCNPTVKDCSQTASLRGWNQKQLPNWHLGMLSYMVSTNGWRRDAWRMKSPGWQMNPFWVPLRSKHWNGRRIPWCRARRTRPNGLPF